MEDKLNFQSNAKRSVFWHVSSPDSKLSDQSWTEEVCLNDLAYLDSGSDSETEKQNAKEISVKSSTESTQDESSFSSAVEPVGTIEDFQPQQTQPQFQFNLAPDQTPVFTPSANFGNIDFGTTFSPSFVPSFGKPTCDFKPSEALTLRNVKTAGMEPEEAAIIEQIHELAFDQQGCRMIQKRLENVEPGESKFASVILESIIPFFTQVACNQFGNYVCQRLIELCPVSELKSLVYSLLPFFHEMSFNQHGTRAM